MSEKMRIIRANCVVSKDKEVSFEISNRQQYDGIYISISDGSGYSCAFVSKDDTRRISTLINTVIGGRPQTQPTHAAVERRALEMINTAQKESGFRVLALYEINQDIWRIWKDRARAKLAAEAQPQPDLEAAVLAKAMEMVWHDHISEHTQGFYLKQARAALTPKAPPSPPKTEAEIRERLFPLDGMISDAAVAEIYSWFPAKGEAA